MGSPKSPVWIAILAVGCAVATMALGWWITPVVGALWAAIVRRSDRPTEVVAIATLVGWIALLVITGAVGPVGQLTALIERILPLPRLFLYPLALALGVGLAGAGSVLVGMVRAREGWDGVERRKSGPVTNGGSPVSNPV